MNKTIYHMCRREEWQSAVAVGAYSGSSQDRDDGFIHFSTKDQVVETAKRHRAGQDGLVLLAVDAAAMGPMVRWEPARGGQLFAHLYGVLPTRLVRAVLDLPLDPSGVHRFPSLED